MRSHSDGKVVFVQRHKTLPSQEYELPHNVRHAAIAEAFEKLQITDVIGVCSVGTLTQKVVPGTVCIPDDYFNVWGVKSGFNDERAHISPSYDESIRKMLLEVVPDAVDGVYVQTHGPRFETKAEVRFLATLGTIVGMTGADEASHCQERKIRYASLCMVDNWGNGIEKGFELNLDNFRNLVKQNEETVQKIVQSVIEKMSKK